MTRFGSIISSADQTTKAIRSGTVTVGVLDLTKAITFGTAMPSANYRVFLTPEANLAVVLWADTKATSGFSLNLSVGVVGGISWLAVEDG